MLYSKTSIANMAISNLGVTKQISNFDTDRSQEGNAVRQWYDHIMLQVQQDFWWSCTTAFATVALVQENPTQEWGFSYRYPANCLDVRRILSGMRTDTRQSRVPFKVGVDSSGGLIYTDMNNAQIEYTMSQVDPTKLAIDFITAFSYRLAAAIAPQITAGDPFKNQQSAMQMYMLELGKAETKSANEEQPDLDPDSEYIRARGGCSNFNGDWRDPLWRP